MTKLTLNNTDTSVESNHYLVQCIGSSVLPGVMLDVQALISDTDGYARRRHSYTMLSLADAHHLIALLSKAITYSEDATVDQPHMELVYRRAA